MDYFPLTMPTRTSSAMFLIYWITLINIAFFLYHQNHHSRSLPLLSFVMVKNNATIFSKVNNTSDERLLKSSDEIINSTHDTNQSSFENIFGFCENCFSLDACISCCKQVSVLWAKRARNAHSAKLASIEFVANYTAALITMFWGGPIAFDTLEHSILLTKNKPWVHNNSTINNLSWPINW